MDYEYKLDYPVLANRIKAARHAAQMTQEQLAEKVGISLNAVSKLEVNLMTVSLQTLIKIANVLQLDMNYLLCSSEDSGETVDEVLDRVIHRLPARDKAFLLHVIQGLGKYHADGRD